MRLGIAAGVDAPLAKRLAGLTFLRLLLLSALLVIVELYYLRTLAFGGFSTVLLLSTVVGAFGLSAAYSFLLQRGKWLEPLTHLQLTTDQITWTLIVYVSGGVSSGSTSLYGLTCLSGAILLGPRGALSGAASGITLYLLMTVGFASGWLPPPPDQLAAAYATTGHELVYPAFSAVMATTLVAALAGYLSERLRAFGGDLDAANKRVAEAEQLAALGRLAAALAHEIRNPLGSIRGSVELLRTGGELSAEDRGLCELVERETARLNDLVTDMLDLSRPRQPDKSTVDLATIAHSVVQLAERSTRSQDVKTSYQGPSSLSVVADSGQMQQVLWNLVRNAIQAAPAESTVSVKLTETDDAIELRVHDDGPGIPLEKRAHIFDAFYTTRAHGVGIGLAVVKQLCDAHGFSISVDLEVQKGTTFVVKIPHQAAAVASRTAQPRAAHILLAVGITFMATQSGCGGSSWVRPSETRETTSARWWAEEAPAEARSANPPAPPPSRSPAPARTPGSASVAPAPLNLSAPASTARALSTYRNTYYDFPQDEASRPGPSAVVFGRDCQPIRKVSKTFHDQLCVQGSGQLSTGETVSFSRRDCECAAECPRTGQKICFDLLDAKKFPYGRGAMGKAITPLRTVAVDSTAIPLGTVLYIPAYQGLRRLDGSPHDGCFIAEDRGLKVKGLHVDIFTGSPRVTRSWNASVPSNRGVRVIIGATRCNYLRPR